MSEVTLIGIDLGKHVYHLHAQDRGGHELWRKKVTRKQLLLLMSNFPRCTLVMEACAGSHCLARELQALGHEAKLIAPQYVKPFVKGNKNDFVDAEAICEAAARPAMRFVTPKTEAQQTLAALHRVREGLVRERTATVNRIHGILLEFGISLPVGMRVIERLPATLAEHSLPPRLVQVLERLHTHFKYLDDQVKQLESELLLQLKDDDNAQRLLAIPGIGAITASLLAAELGDAKHFCSGRDFAASIGLVPRQYSTGGRAVLLGISKRGDKSMRCLLIQCARSVMTRVHRRTDALGDWIRKMLLRRHSNVVACALANKLARIAWAVLYRRSDYRILKAAAS